MDEILRSAVDENPDTAEVQAEAPDLTAAPEESAVATLAAERDQLAQQKAELQDRYLRLQAEFDNFRRRTERERMDFAEYAGQQTILEILPVLDDFERALRAAADAGRSDDEFVKGVDLIYKRLMETLQKLGLEPIEAEGAPFDPHQHEAIQRLHSDDHEDNTVVQEYRRGYNFKGRNLRPSVVQVSVKP